ncbi:hypothetical protein V9T40_010477 [Parthenolecanium corni]|uniref:ornithine decarboxylase n=1 Tax=Parthenolecanium corni TaxID=536013 RepID=A0AAN9Y1C0_9HEMI
MKRNLNQSLKRNLEPDRDILNVTRRIAENISPDETFYILNVEDVLLKVNNWRRKLPRVTPYYAVKSNAHPTLLRILSALGVCFDCASKAEIKTVLSLGVHPSRIIFANPTKLPSHLEYAAEQNVNTTTADGEVELYRIKQLHPTAKY